MVVSGTGAVAWPQDKYCEEQVASVPGLPRYAV